MTTTTETLARLMRADAAAWGQTLEAGARSTAAVLAAVYAAGLVLGTWVHRLSEALAALARRPHLTTPQQRATAPPAQCQPATASALDRLTVHQLRQLARGAGHRALARNGRRAQLLEALA